MHEQPPLSSNKPSAVFHGLYEGFPRFRPLAEWAWQLVHLTFDLNLCKAKKIYTVVNGSIEVLMAVAAIGSNIEDRLTCMHRSLYMHP